MFTVSTYLKFYLSLVTSAYHAQPNSDHSKTDLFSVLLLTVCFRQWTHHCRTTLAPPWHQPTYLGLDRQLQVFSLKNILSAVTWVMTSYCSSPSSVVWLTYTAIPPMWPLPLLPHLLTHLMMRTWTLQPETPTNLDTALMTHLQMTILIIHLKTQTPIIHFQPQHTTVLQTLQMKDLLIRKFVLNVVSWWWLSLRCEINK